MGLPRSLINKLFKKKNANGEWEWSGMAIGGTALNVGFAGMEYNDKRAEGNGVITSAMSAAGDLALGALSMPLLIGTTLAPELARGAVSAYDSASSYSRQLQRQGRNRPFQNATFVDTQQTYTMRQAGMNLARQGQMAAQQTSMGNEAASIGYMGR